MSTSPSWFDQEKFSRLVKKVGKTMPMPESTRAPGQPGAESEDLSASTQGLASTARISLVSKPPSLLSEQRALPALPRRTTPLPSLKALFPAAPPASPATTEATDSPSSEAQPAGEPVKEDGAPASAEPEAGIEVPPGLEGNDLAEVWLKMGQLNEELAHAVLERDHALSEGNTLREELRKADEALAAKSGTAAPTEEMARITKERDEALKELNTLREQARSKPKADLRSATQSQELSLLTGERDQARKEYIELRGQFETLKKDQAPREDAGRGRKDLEQQLEGFRQKLEEKNKEIAALKSNPTSSGSLRAPGSGEGGDEKLKQEIASLREQLTRSKDEASIAQRGLALSQKALHETRDTLREATEGSSLSRHNFDNLKNECAILSQQNTVLQAQNEQLTRDLAAAKSKMTSRL